MHKRMIEIQNRISEFDETDERFGQRGGHRNRTHSDAGGSGFGVARAPPARPLRFHFHIYLKKIFIREHRTMSFDVLFTINLFFQNPSGRQKGKKKTKPTKTTPDRDAAVTQPRVLEPGPPAHASPRRLGPRGASPVRGPRPAPPASLAAPASLPHATAAASVSQAHDAASCLPSRAACRSRRSSPPRV